MRIALAIDAMVLGLQRALRRMRQVLIRDVSFDGPPQPGMCP